VEGEQIGRRGHVSSGARGGGASGRRVVADRIGSAPKSWPPAYPKFAPNVSG